MNTSQDPPPKPKSIAFPIINEKGNWRNTGKPQIASVANEPAAIIQKAQPYRAKHAPNPEPLTLLAGLNNKDKHRTIVPIATMPESFDQVGRIITSEKDVGFAVVRTDEPVEKDARLWMFQFSRTTYVKMEYHAVFEIVLDLGKFPNTSVQTHYPFGRLLGDIAEATNELVTSLKPFL